ADALHDDVARHFEQHVADEEDAGGEAEHAGREAEVRVHRQRGEADVDPVDEGEEVQYPHERDQPPRDFAQRAPAQLGVGVAHRKILPGLRMPCGSHALLIERISSTTSEPYSATSLLRLPWPMPCSPVQVPPTRSARSIIAS